MTTSTDSDDDTTVEEIIDLPTGVDDTEPLQEITETEEETEEEIVEVDDANAEDDEPKFQVFRYKCGCIGDGNDCAERGGYQYIIVKENAEDSVVIPLNGHRIDQRNKSFYTCYCY